MSRKVKRNGCLQWGGRQRRRHGTSVIIPSFLFLTKSAIAINLLVYVYVSKRMYNLSEA